MRLYIMWQTHRHTYRIGHMRFSPSLHPDNTQRHWSVGLLLIQERNMRLAQNSSRHLTSPSLLPGDSIPYCVINKQAVECTFICVSRCMGVHVLFSLIECTICELDSMHSAYSGYCILYIQLNKEQYTLRCIIFMCITGPVFHTCCLTIGFNVCPLCVCVHWHMSSWTR